MNLCDEMRPETFEDIFGQAALTNEGSALRRLVEARSFDSIIFVGPPGTGKTSLAKLMGKVLHVQFYQMHASTAGAVELKKISDAAQNGIETLVFIDEIHRYNKSQQNLLLKLIDDRAVRLVGASTENPYYNLVPALRSRSFIFKLGEVSDSSLKLLADKAIIKLCKMLDVESIDTKDVVDILIKASAGDVRRFLNLLELSALIGARSNGCLTLSTVGLMELASKKAYSDDEHYDLLSAMIKSVRGSDPDAALLWAFKLIKSGVQPEAIYRRLMISAAEDIGNAYPDATAFIHASYENFMNVGSPEGLIIFAQAVTFLATCPKSNKSYMAFHGVEKYLEENDPKVPENIAHSAVGYKYPFDYGSFVDQNYTKERLQFYSPSEAGFEVKILERLKRLWKGSKHYE